jgi:hypothetical protein
MAADSTPPGTKELAAGAAAFHHRGGPFAEVPRQFHLGNINVPENCAANTSTVAQSEKHQRI